MKFISKKSTISIFAYSLFLGLFLFNAKGARAGIFPTAEDIAMWIPKIIFQITLSIAQFFTSLFAKLFTAILKFGFQDMSAVHLGWTISRDFINMFFILALVVIAFATILRFETYGMKALLPRLIIIALLINFSYLACGIIIDATQITTNFFINKIEGGDDLGQVLIDTSGASKALNIESGEQLQYIEKEGAISKNLRLIISMAFVIGITVLTGIILLIGSILLITRIGALWILIILAPFAWFFSIFPALKGMSSKWWNNFLKYSFFAPIYAFFIYLSITIANQLLKQNFGADKLEEIGKIGIGGSPVLTNIFSYAVIIILLLGAPIVAMSMGIYGSKTVIGGAKGIFNGTRKWAGRRIGAGARRVRPEKWARGLATASRYTRIPGLKLLGRAFGNWADKGTTRINEEAGKLPTLSEKETANRLRLTTDPYKKMAWTQKLSEVARDPANISLVKENLKKYERMGGSVVKDVIANDLTLARTKDERSSAALFRKSTGKTALKENEAKDIKSVEAMRGALGTNEFIKVVDKMPSAIKDAISDTLLGAANTSATPITGNSLEQRKTFAKITNRPADAFKSPTEFFKDEFKNYMHKMKPKDYGDIKGEYNISNAANGMDESTASDVVKFMSREAKEIAGKWLPPGVKDKLRGSPAWGRYIPRKKK